jgi:hypothetical protein
MTDRIPPLLDRVERVRLLAKLLDQAWRVPGTNYRFGLDGLIGLIPGIGDAATLLLSAYIVYEAAKLGVPKATLLRMAGRVGIDSLVGAVPILGDLFDFAYKSNTKNLETLEKHLSKQEVRRQEVTPRDPVRPMKVSS